MPREKLKNIKIPSLDDDIFLSDEKKAIDSAEKIIQVPLNKIDDFKEHPFHVKEDVEMLDMIESIARIGVLSPAIIRPKSDGRYEMIAGHRRKYACFKNGMETIPCQIKELNDDEATIIMVDTNLRQRQNILPSEKAFAYRMLLDAMTRQGYRSDLTSGPVDQKLKSQQHDVSTSDPVGPRFRANAELSKKVQESTTQIKRYIRLTYLIEPLLEYVDQNKIALRPAVELSYLTQEEQTVLLTCMERNDCTPSHDQSIRMRKLHDDDQLNEVSIQTIMDEEKPNQVEKFKISKNRIARFFSPKTSAKEMENEIEKALEFYQRYKNRIKNKDAR